MSEAAPNGVEIEPDKDLIPPLACHATRTAIRDSMIYIKRTEYFLDEDDEGHDEQYDGLDSALTTAQEAFDCKPDGCEMQCDSNDNYYCPRCDFEADMDPLQP